MGGDGVGGDAGEQVGSVGAAHLGADLVCWPAVGGLAPGGQKQHLITDVQMGQTVGDHQHPLRRLPHDHCRRPPTL